MAQQLHAQGQHVALLALFDTYLPGSKTNNFVQKVDRLVGDLLVRRPKEGLSYLFGMLGSKVGTSVQGLTRKIYPRREGSVTRTMRDVLEANRDALRNYTPQMYPGQITLLLSSEAPERSFYDRRLGWSDMAADGLEVQVVPADSCSILRIDRWHSRRVLPIEIGMAQVHADACDYFSIVSLLAWCERARLNRTIRGEDNFYP